MIYISGVLAVFSFLAFIGWIKKGKRWMKGLGIVLLAASALILLFLLGIIRQYHVPKRYFVNSDREQFIAVGYQIIE